MPLNLLHVDTVEEVILEALVDAGYDDPTEAIPGLISAVLTLANENDQLLDEAADLLANDNF
jgi:hypothetical protein